MKALITGASSGLGKSMAYYLSELGYDLILVARRKDLLKNIKKELKTKVTIVPLDLSDVDNVNYLFNMVKDKDIDLLINNAGFGYYGEFNETDINRELKMIDLNIKTVHILTKKFYQLFLENNKGTILNVASSAGFMAGPKLSTYYATKNYVLKLSLAIYEELRRKKKNVSISVLCPGPVDTEFNDVANCSFGTKSLTSDYVAKYAIDKCLKGKLIIIPSFKMKAAIFAIRILPTKLLLRINYRIQNKKQN